jgi:hypothetical protein
MSAPRAGAIAATVLAALLAAAVGVRPTFYGVRWMEVGLFWLFVGASVVGPGAFLVRRLGWHRGDLAFALGMSGALGLAFHSTLYVASRAVGAPALAFAAPVFTLAAVAGYARDREGPAVGAGRAWAPLLAVMLVAVMVQPLFSDRLLDQALPADHLFHVGNTGALRHHWPLQDPRVAGLPLNYHAFGYAPAAGAADWTGAPAARVVLALAWAPPLLLLLLQIFNAGRLAGGSALAGSAAAAMVALHADVGAELGVRGGFLSFFGSAVYGSLTTVTSLLYLCTLAIVLHRWLEGGHRGRGDAAALALLALAASGTKGSVMPVVLAALGTLALLGLLARDRGARPVLGALAVTAAAAAPLTLWLTFGPESYGGMFRLQPGTLVHSSGAFQAACSALGATDVRGACTAPGWATALAVPFWVIGYLGLAGVAVLLARRRERGRPSPFEAWAGLVLLFGLLAALLLHTWGASQLFFLYNGQLLLAVLAGPALVRLARPARLPALALLGAFALPLALRAAREVPATASHDSDARALRPSLLAVRYREGLDWLRLQSAPDAVVVSEPGAMLVSAFAERRAFYETGFFTARGHRVRWDGVWEPFPERLAGARRLVAAPEPEEARRVLGDAAAGSEVYVLCDNALRLEEPGWSAVAIRPLAPPSERAGQAPVVFANEALRIHRLPPLTPSR